MKSEAFPPELLEALQSCEVCGELAMVLTVKIDVVPVELHAFCEKHKPETA